MKCGVFEVGGLLLLPLLVGALAGPAEGVPVEVFFDGPLASAQPGGTLRNEGLSLEQAVATGIDFVRADSFRLDGVLRIDARSADGDQIPAGEPAPNEVPSEWLITKTFQGDFGNDAYLLFTTAQNFGGSTYNVDYPMGGCLPTDPLCPENDRAGLIIDSDDGWRIIDSTRMGERFLYVGILLDDFMNAGTSCGDVDMILDGQACVALRYFLEDPEAQLQPGPGSDRLLSLPRLGVLFAVVPEPGTGALLGVGLTMLAAAGRRQS